MSALSITNGTKSGIMISVREEDIKKDFPKTPFIVKYISSGAIVLIYEVSHTTFSGTQINNINDDFGLYLTYWKNSGYDIPKIKIVIQQ